MALAEESVFSFFLLGQDPCGHAQSVCTAAAHAELAGSTRGRSKRDTRFLRLPLHVTDAPSGHRRYLSRAEFAQVVGGHGYPTSV